MTNESDATPTSEHPSADPTVRAMGEQTADAPETEPDAAGGTPSGLEGRALGGMTRDELETHAASLGIESPADFPNKDALADAIVSAQETPTAASADAQPDAVPELPPPDAAPV